MMLVSSSQLLTSAQSWWASKHPRPHPRNQKAWPDQAYDNSHHIPTKTVNSSTSNHHEASFECAGTRDLKEIDFMSAEVAIVQVYCLPRDNHQEPLNLPCSPVGTTKLILEISCYRIRPYHGAIQHFAPGGSCGRRGFRAFCGKPEIM